MKKFESPDDLWKYSLDPASALIAEGYKEQAAILESKAKLSCTTGWEWLGELGVGVQQIRAMGILPTEFERKLDNILKTTKSEAPYG